METSQPVGPAGTGLQKQLSPRSSRAEIPRGRAHGVLRGEKWCESILPTRGIPRELAHLSLAQFPLHPVCDSCNLFFKSKGNNQSLPVFPGNITCFRPCRKGRGCCSPNHHVLSPHASLACVQTRPQGLGGFSWTRGSGKEESLLPPAGDVPASVLLPPDGVLGLWQWVRRGFLCHGVTS